MLCRSSHCTDVYVSVMCNVAGEGTFGIVLQAKAEHIVKSAPHRNIVAVKTPRGM